MGGRVNSPRLVSAIHAAASIFPNDQAAAPMPASHWPKTGKPAHLSAAGFRLATLAMLTLLRFLT